MPLARLARQPDQLAAARSKDRAVLLWGFAIAISGTLALIEGNEFVLLFVAIALPFVPACVSNTERAFLIGAAASALLFGPTFILIAVPIGLYFARMRGAAATAVLVLAVTKLLSHHFQAIPDLHGYSIHLGSAVFLALPSLAAAAVFGLDAGWRSVVFLIVATIIALLCVDLAGARWITHDIFTSPVFRTGLVLLPLAAIFPTLRLRNHDASNRQPIWLAFGIVVGAVITVMLPTKPIASIVFDESHGRWETVLASFGPNDFGRSANYTYSLLFNYAAKIAGSSSAYEREDNSLPGPDAVFVLKMPSQPLSAEFSDRLEVWVRNGGRLLIVADHTDLYDSTQNLNAFLQPRFGAKINADAVFDPKGLPNIPITGKFAALFGSINASGQPLAWQTGASLGSLPLNAVQLANFGVSFSEPGDYSRPNRFGPFIPRMSLRFGNHSAVIGYGVGLGAIVVILDSTPWSNFSIFVGQYKALFGSIIYSLSHPVALTVWGWGSITLALFAFGIVVFRHPALFALSGVALGVTLGCAAQIGSASFRPSLDGRDFGLRIISGSSVRSEFLKQLVQPGERSFARILTAMAKYDLDPSASGPGLEIPSLGESRKWLFIQPDIHQLPDSEEIISHLTKGGDISILFGPEQAANPKIRGWLEKLGLVTQRATALALAEDARTGGLLNRRGAILLRDVRTLTVPKQTARLKDRESDQLMQSYTARPTTFPRTSGLFNVGFSADQFSDDAVGEIWEGIYPSAIGKLRERQLAALLLGQELPAPMPTELVQPSGREPQSNLAEYLMMIDGKTVLTGRFAEKKGDAPVNSLSTLNADPAGYLMDLRNRSMAFIASSCPRSAKVTQCDARLLGADMLEWMVSWAATENGEVAAIELLHERRFSGVGNTVNVVYGN